MSSMETKGWSGDSACEAPRTIGLTGVIIGGVIAVGVPLIAVTLGGNVGMGKVTAIILSLLGIGGGVAVSIVSAFFSIVVHSRYRMRAMGVADVKKDAAQLPAPDTAGAKASGEGE
jgi:hypothetical protein